jgi:hypothetical protein
MTAAEELASKGAKQLLAAAKPPHPRRSGDSEKALKMVFDVAKTLQPSLLFIVGRFSTTAGCSCCASCHQQAASLFLACALPECSR